MDLSFPRLPAAIFGFSEMEYFNIFVFCIIVCKKTRLDVLNHFQQHMASYWKFKMAAITQVNYTEIVMLVRHGSECGHLAAYKIWFKYLKPFPSCVYTISSRIWQWNKFENRSTFAEVMIRSQVTWLLIIISARVFFWDTVYIVLRNQL